MLLLIQNEAVQKSEPFPAVFVEVKQLLASDPVTFPQSQLYLAVFRLIYVRILVGFALAYF